MPQLKSDLYQDVTDSIIKAIKNGTPPWEQPWISGLPRNFSTGNTYNGINIPLLWGQAAGEGFQSNDWLTFNQARKIKGASVKKGSKGQMIVYWMLFEKDNGTINRKGEKVLDKIPYLRKSVVFNREQIDGLPPVEKTTPDWEPHDRAEQLIQATGADIRVGGNVASYNRTGDFIRMPGKADFASLEGYLSTKLHEVTHWTGHESRLDRQFGSEFGDEIYAKEEMIAQLGSAFLLASLGIPNELNQHAAYMASWLKALQDDKKLIVKASSLAQKAANFVLNGGIKESD